MRRPRNKDQNSNKKKMLPVEKEMKTSVLSDEEKVEIIETSIKSLEEVKHPLENNWCFWFYTNKKKKWEDNLVLLTNFNTVEDYWCLYHHMVRPSELSNGQDYAIFKEGIRPMWEDEANTKGGRWLCNVDSKGDIDWLWSDLVLLLIGENFDNNKEICGIVINVRQKCKISVWTADANNQEGIEEIGRKIRSVIGKQGKLGFQLHNSTKNIY